jgi:hypothetical protein
MSHFLIFDSSATRDTRGVPVDMSISPQYVHHTKPVRLYGSPDGDVQRVGFEFNLLGTSNTAVPIRWYMQFFNDRITGVGNDPSFPYQVAADGMGRDAPIIGYQDLQWARECVEIVGGGGAIAHFPAARLITLNPVAVTLPDGGGAPDGLASVYFPMTVHAMWVRLALWQNAGDQAMPADHRLLIFAVAGGYANPKTMEEQDRPWAGTSNGILGD